MYIEISDGVTTQKRKLKPDVTLDRASAIVEAMWQADDMGYSYYLTDDAGNELLAFEN